MLKYNVTMKIEATPSSDVEGVFRQVAEELQTALPEYRFYIRLEEDKRTLRKVIEFTTEEASEGVTEAIPTPLPTDDTDTDIKLRSKFMSLTKTRD